MAILHSKILFTGTIGDIVVVKRRDTGKYYARSKPTRSKKKNKSKSGSSKERNQSEFGGRATATKWIRKALYPQKDLSDFGFTSALNRLVNPILQMDTTGEYGKRAIFFTKGHALLRGFNLNNKTIFDSIIRHPIDFFLSKESLYASVKIPDLMPGINFVVPGNQAMYRVVAALGIVPDLHCKNKKYTPGSDYDKLVSPVRAETRWYPVLKGSAVETLELKIPTAPPDESFCLLLSIGIRFGNIIDEGKVKQEKYAGAAKILWVT